MNRINAALAVLLVLSSANYASASPKPTYSLKVTEINGCAVPGDPEGSVIAFPGDLLTVEHYVRDWSPNGERLTGTQTQLDETSFSSAPKGFVEPASYEENMKANLENKDNAFLDIRHPKYIHLDEAVVPITDYHSPGYRWLSIKVNRPGPLSKQDGKEYYCGTVVFEVSSNARGVFRIDFDHDPQRTLMIEDIGAPISPIEFEPLTIDVRQPANSTSVSNLINLANIATDASATQSKDDLLGLSTVIESLNVKKRNSHACDSRSSDK